MDYVDVGTGIAAMLVEAYYVYAALNFRMEMQKGGAKVWVGFSSHMIALAACLLIGQILVFIPPFTMASHMQSFYFAGDVFWLLASLFGFTMISAIASKVREAFG